MKPNILSVIVFLFVNAVFLGFPFSGRAQPIEVSFKADFSFPQQPPPFSGSHLSVEFPVPSLASATFHVESTNAFLFRDVPAILRIDNVTFSNEISEVGWFNFQPDPNTGIDIRFAGVFQAGDVLQVLCQTQVPLFSGPTQTPILGEIELTGLVGGIYYLLSGTNNAIMADFSNGEYVQRLAAPVLSIKLTNNMVMVCWPSSSLGYNLQVNTNLATTNWVMTAESITDNGTFKYIIVNPPSGSRSYRLENQ